MTSVVNSVKVLKVCACAIIVAICCMQMYSQATSPENRITDSNSVEDKEYVETETIEVKDVHSDVKGVTVIIKYNKTYKEARITYTCDYDTYDKSDAVTSLRDCLGDFIKTQGCYHYIRLYPDEEKFHKINDRKVAQITSYVRIYR